MARKSKSSAAVKPPTTEAAAFPLSDKERNALRDRLESRQRAPRLEAQSAPGKPLKIGYPSKADHVRLAAAFGTADEGFANLMLSGLLNAACDGSPSKPPSEQTINETLAAVRES